MLDGLESEEPEIRFNMMNHLTCFKNYICLQSFNGFIKVNLFEVQIVCDFLNLLWNVLVY